MRASLFGISISFTMMSVSGLMSAVDPQLVSRMASAPSDVGTRKIFDRINKIYRIF
jgi:hypothetical protein